MTAAIRQAFGQSDRVQAGETRGHAADVVRNRRSRLCARMAEAGHDVLARTSFPARHRTTPHRTNPTERLNEEAKRRGLAS